MGNVFLGQTIGNILRFRQKIIAQRMVQNGKNIFIIKGFGIAKMNGKKQFKKNLLLLKEIVTHEILQLVN